MLAKICPKAPKFEIDWEFIDEQFDWFRRLATCDQDPVWHAEGNVQIHTKMVCQALIEQAEWRKLPVEQRQATFLATLFHDVGKPITTQIIDGRVKAPNHALRGSYICREQLIKAILPTQSLAELEQRELVTQLVRFHGVPLNIFDKPDPVRTLHRLSLQLRHHLLALVARADVLGRQCDDQSKILDRIEMFVELCSENRCLERKVSFANDAVRLMYFEGKEVTPDTDLSVPFNGTATMLTGLPGSGKDVWLASNKGHRAVVSLDQIREALNVKPEGDQGKVVTIAKETCKQLMRERKDFILNATNVTRRLRQIWKRLFLSYNYRIKTVYLETDWKNLLSRNADRRMQSQVPVNVLEKLVRKLDLPYTDESHRVEWICN